MSGYTPAFSDMYMGTLFGRWPAAAVWATLIPLMDRYGRIDMSLPAIAGMTGWPLDLLEQGINQLMEPDPKSRSKEEGGRRLVLIEPDRPWGWRAVTHSKHRDRARKSAYDEERTESGADAERKRETRQNTKRPDTSRRVPTRPDVSPSPSPSPSPSEEKIRQGDGQLALTAVPAIPPKRPSKKTPHEYQPSQQLLDEMRVECPLVDLDRALKMMKDHTFPMARTDWDGTFRNWCRTDQEKAQRFQPRKPEQADPFKGVLPIPKVNQ